MRFVVNNIETKIVVGGTDYLLNVDFTKLLREYLRVRVDGYGHTEAYKEHVWDGFRYFITEDLRFATGFLPLVIKYVRELGAKCIIQDERGELPKLKDTIDDYIGIIDGKEFYGRDYQVDIAKKAGNSYIENGTMYFPRGIYDCAPNAGKDAIMALMIKNFDRQYRTIITVSSEEIFRKAVKFFSQVIGEPVGTVAKGKFNPKWLTICMVKTVYNMAKKSVNVKKWLKDTEVLFVDESDEAGAKEYSKLLVKIGAGMRVFVSGTALDADSVNNMVSIGLSGLVLGKITTKFLIDNGYSQRIYINMMLNRVNQSMCLGYEAEIRNIIWKSQSKMRDIFEIITKHKGEPVFIAYEEVVHGEYLYSHIIRQFPDLRVELIHGSTKDGTFGASKKKSDLVDDFINKDIDVLISSSILRRGVNMSAMRAFIFADIGKARREIKQWLGRPARHDGVHDDVHAYDWYNWGRYVGEHSKKRIKLYQEEQFDMIYHYEHKKGVPIGF